MDRSLPHAAGKAAVKVNGDIELLALKQRCGKNSCIELLVGFGISRFCLGKNRYGFVFPDRQHAKPDLFRQMHLDPDETILFD